MIAFGIGCVLAIAFFTGRILSEIKDLKYEIYLLRNAILALLAKEKTKGFIEVNCIEIINNSAPIVLKVKKQIALKPEFILGFADNHIAIKGCQEITLKVEETYEEINQKIKQV